MNHDEGYYDDPKKQPRDHSWLIAVALGLALLAAVVFTSFAISTQPEPIEPPAIVELEEGPASFQSTEPPIPAFKPDVDNGLPTVLRGVPRQGTLR